MKHGIKTNDNVIAKFEHESDRDACMEALAKIYTDCEFEAVNDLEETVGEKTDESAN